MARIYKTKGGAAGACGLKDVREEKGTAMRVENIVFSSYCPAGGESGWIF